jgi:hypothetical protein
MISMHCHSERSEAESKNLSILLGVLLPENVEAFVGSLARLGMTH